MDRFQKPFRGHVPTYLCLSRPEQHFASHGSKLKTETHVVAKTGDRATVHSPLDLATHQVGEHREIVPDPADLLGKWVAPSLHHIGNRLGINPDDDLKRFGLMSLGIEAFSSNFKSFYRDKVSKNPSLCSLSKSPISRISSALRGARPGRSGSFLLSMTFCNAS